MKTAHAVLLFLGMLFFVFCGRESESTYLRDMLSSFEAKSIHFPEKMLCVENGVPGFRDVCISLPTLIIYVGPDECNDCALAHLLEKDTLFKWAEESKSFQVYVIFSSRSGSWTFRFCGARVHAVRKTGGVAAKTASFMGSSGGFYRFLHYTTPPRR